MRNSYQHTVVLSIALVALMNAFISFKVSAAAPIKLTVKKEPLQQMRYGIDYERLWFWSNSLSSKEKELVAEWSVVDCDIDFVRVAINSSYELSEGDYDLSAYTKRIIPMMQSMQEANPEIKFFASPRPLNESYKGEEKKRVAWQPYPRWITGDPGKGNSSNAAFDFDWEKCAEYLVRYVELMKSHGFKISYLDVTNEWQSVGTGGRLTGEDVKEIHKYMKSELGADDMPLFIAPSSWNFQQGTAWIRSLTGSREKKAVHIASSHNTDKTGTAQQFADAVNDTLGSDTEVWNTELHGWKSTSGQDEVLTSSFLFEAIRAGFSGISGWLAIGTPKQGHSYILNENGTPVRNVKYFIFKKLTTTSHRGHALNINQPKKLKSTAALIRENLLTVWVINDSEEDLPIHITHAESRFASKKIKSTRWSEVHDLPVTGQNNTINSTSDTELETTLEGRSLYCFEIQLAP